MSNLLQELPPPTTIPSHTHNSASPPEPLPKEHRILHKTNHQHQKAHISNHCPPRKYCHKQSTQLTKHLRKADGLNAAEARWIENESARMNKHTEKGGGMVMEDVATESAIAPEQRPSILSIAHQDYDPIFLSTNTAISPARSVQFPLAENSVDMSAGIHEYSPHLEQEQEGEHPGEQEGALPVPISKEQSPPISPVSNTSSATLPDTPPTPPTPTSQSPNPDKSDDDDDDETSTTATFGSIREERCISEEYNCVPPPVISNREFSTLFPDLAATNHTSGPATIVSKQNDVSDSDLGLDMQSCGSGGQW